MTADEIEKEIHLISQRLRVIDQDTPEMSGMDWARDHGWIPDEEWEAAEEKSRSKVHMQETEVQKIELLRREYPQAMDQFLHKHIERLKTTLDALQRLGDEARARKSEFAMQFNLTLLPDIISCFNAWKRHTKPKHWPAWMRRVAFSVVEECEAYTLRFKFSSEK